MNRRNRTISSGLISGLIQGNILLLVTALLASRALDPVGLAPAWEVATFSGVSISFVVGLILADAYDTVKALVLSLAVALAFSMPLVYFLGISVTVSPEQGYAQATFFVLLIPAVLFTGSLVGIIASISNRALKLRQRKPLTRRTRKVFILLTIILASLFGFYVFSTVTQPNYSVVAPAMVSEGGNYFSNNNTWGWIAVRFNVTVNPIRGYTGTVTAFDPIFPDHSLCSPAHLQLPTETSFSCAVGLALPPGVYLLRYRTTDGSITHDFYIQLIVS